MPPKKSGDDFLEVLRKLTHTLSQPLTSLRGSVEVALMGELNKSECRQVLELALQESHRMAETLETFRELLEMESSSEEAQPVSWTHMVERSLEESAAVHKGRGLQLLSSVRDGVWVKGLPQHLDTATRRLIRAVIESGRGERAVRVGLSVRGETACLSVCAESLLPGAEALPQGERKHLLPETWGSGDLDWWIVRRAIELQGGWLKIGEVSRTCRCYRLSLPLASSKVVHRS